MSEMGHKKRRLEDVVRIETQSILDSVGFHSATGLKAINVAALNDDIAKSLARLTEWVLRELQKVSPPELVGRTAENGTLSSANGARKLPSGPL
jgi:hypothetical protein